MIEEPWIEAVIYVPDEHLGSILKVCQDRRGIQKNLTYVAGRAQITYELPLNEVVFDFYDRLKSISRGYASFDYHQIGHREGDLVKMNILVNGEPVDALSMIVHRAAADARGRQLCERLKDLIPRHLFKIPIQAAIGGKVIARETIAALRKDVKADDAYSLGPQQEALRAVQKIQVELSRLDQEMAAIELEAADSELFILGLQRKIAALQDSSSTAEVVSEIRYIWCPSCFSRLPDEENGETCRLCKAPFDREKTRRRIVAQMNELRIQMEQSQALQKERRSRLDEFRRSREAARQEWEVAQANLRRMQSSPTSEKRSHLRKLTEEVGYIRRQIEGVNERAALIEQLDELSRKKEELAASIASFEDRNARLKATEQERLSKGYTKVAEETVWFLKNDLPRQDSFKDPKVVHFSFEKDKISIDGESYFSASSTVLLKNSFLVGLLFAAAQDEDFRHFRLAILDTLEDKGMEPERSQNFQRLLVKRSEEVPADHQLIFATAMIDPTLADSGYVVGKFSTHQERTLNIG